MQFYVLIYAKFIRKLSPLPKRRQKPLSLRLLLYCQRILNQAEETETAEKLKQRETIKVSITPAKWCTSMKTGERFIVKFIDLSSCFSIQAAFLKLNYFVSISPQAPFPTVKLAIATLKL
jgi:hypothetical protein